MTSEIPTPEGEKKEPPKVKEGGPKKPKPSISEAIDSLKKSEKIETIYSYAKSNTLDTVAYIALILGIVWLFVNPTWGGLLVGIVFGYYFAQELSHMVKNANTWIEEQGMVRSLVFGGTLLALFLMVPYIFIGAAIVVGLKQIMAPNHPND